MKKLLFTALLAGALFACEDATNDTVPTNVRTAFEQAYPAATDVEWDKEGDTWEVDFEINGEEMEINYDANGMIVEMED